MSAVLNSSLEELLAVLADSTAPHSARRQAVLETEVLRFEADKLPQLNDALLQFIQTNRDSNDPEDQIAVAAAIRKLIAEATTADLDSFALLLEPGSRAAVPLEVELEVAKMVVRKLTVNPSLAAELDSLLADQLFDIVHAYLNDRLLGREKYAAVTVNAVLAVLLLHSPHFAEVIQRVGQLRSGWFKTMLNRRGSRIANEIRERDPEAAARLAEFVAPLAQSGQREVADASVPAQ